MIDPITAHIWRNRALFLALCTFVIGWKMLPLDTSQGGLPPPDLLILLTLCWHLRQPAVVPLAVVVLVFGAADILFHKPLGLTTLFMVLTIRALRRRRADLLDLNFITEWAIMGGIIAAISLGERLALILIFADPVPLGLGLQHLAVTVLCYPLVVAISKFLLGLRKLRLADLDPA